MKKSAILLLGLLMSVTLTAQPSQPATTAQRPTGGQIAAGPQTSEAARTPSAPQRRPQTGAMMAKPEHYLYAELIGDHLPQYNGSKIIFDFGQATDAWSYNWLTDEQGRKIRFDSMVEALNYMIRQRWEFVQAYTSGEENEYTHYLLRIRAEEIPEHLRTQLPPVPDGTDADPEESAAEQAPANAEQGSAPQR